MKKSEDLKADPILRRSVKLTGIAAGISICLCGLSFFLPATDQWFLWGASGGMIAAMLIFLEGLRRRASKPAKLAPADKRAAISTTVAVIIGSVLAAFTRHLLGDAAQMVLLGGALGVLAAIGLVLSPLFYKSTPRGSIVDKVK